MKKQNKNNPITIEPEDNTCPYCGNTKVSTDPDVLCDECLEIFGHAFYSEL